MLHGLRTWLGSVACSSCGWDAHDSDKCGSCSACSSVSGKRINTAFSKERLGPAGELPLPKWIHVLFFIVLNTFPTKVLEKSWIFLFFCNEDFSYRLFKYSMLSCRMTNMRSGFSCKQTHIILMGPLDHLQFDASPKEVAAYSWY